MPGSPVYLPGCPPGCPPMCAICATLGVASSLSHDSASWPFERDSPGRSLWSPEFTSGQLVGRPHSRVWGWLVVGWGHLSLITGQASPAWSVGGRRVPKNSKRARAPMFWLFVSLLKMTKSRVTGRGLPQMEDPGRCKVIVTLPVTTPHG